MADALYSHVTGSTIGDPGPLPFSACTSTGEFRTDLAGQLAEGHLTAADLRDMGLWPVVEVRPLFDPATHRLIISGRQKRTNDVRITYTAETLPLPPDPPAPTLTPIATVARAVVRLDPATGDMAKLDGIGIDGVFEDEPGALIIFPSLPLTGTYIPDIKADGVTTDYGERTPETFRVLFTAPDTGAMTRPLGNITIEVKQ